MTNSKFERAARLNKAKAFFLTAVLHVVLIGGISTYGDGSLSEMLPEKVKSFLGWEDDMDNSMEQNDEVALRP